MTHALRVGTGRLEIARDALLVAAAKVAVSAAVLVQGFRALSDDDYARIVIAQRFVVNPSFDPSGTSWLPFPFWIYGALMSWFGRDPSTARAIAFGLGVAGALLVWVAARWLGASRNGALLGALIACAFPYSAWLGVATVPEALTAALVVFGAASTAVTGPRRVMGALALCAACLSRYEAWPVAVVFAGLSVRDAITQRKAAPGVSALIAVAAPVIWIVHGVTNHGDAMFFLTRVAAYRRALGAQDTSLLASIFGYPLAVVRCEPELLALATVGLWGIWPNSRGEFFARYRRLFFQLAALIGFLVAGDVFDGAPTHHAERAVLAIWFGAAIVGGDALVRSASALEPHARKRLTLAGAAVLLLCAGLVRPWFARRDSFIDRGAELEIGARARAALGSDDRLGIYTTDFGFFAVIAGFSAPERAIALDQHDPRAQSVTLPRSGHALAERLNAKGASWFIVPRSWLEVALTVGAVSVELDEYVLMQIRYP